MKQLNSHSHEEHHHRKGDIIDTYKEDILYATLSALSGNKSGMELLSEIKKTDIDNYKLGLSRLLKEVRQGKIKIILDKEHLGKAKKSLEDHKMFYAVEKEAIAKDYIEILEHSIVFYQKEQSILFGIKVKFNDFVHSL